MGCGGVIYNGIQCVGEWCRVLVSGGVRLCFVVKGGEWWWVVVIVGERCWPGWGVVRQCE